MGKLLLYKTLLYVKVAAVLFVIVRMYLFGFRACSGLPEFCAGQSLEAYVHFILFVFVYVIFGWIVSVAKKRAENENLAETSKLRWLKSFLLPILEVVGIIVALYIVMYGKLGGL